MDMARSTDKAFGPIFGLTSLISLSSMLSMVQQNKKPFESGATAPGAVAYKGVKPLYRSTCKGQVSKYCVAPSRAIVLSQISQFRLPLWAVQR
jgi:hypothetical protein